METWLQEDTNKPLLIVADYMCGKKTLLCGFMAYVSRKYSHYVCMAEFASITPVYSNVLYKVMINLRVQMKIIQNRFNIYQKVELNEYKLRRYLKYWLEITSEIIEKQYLGYRKEEKQKVVIVIEGIDLLTDSKGCAVLPSFWLPLTVPTNVKLILSASVPQNDLVNRVSVLQYSISKEKMGRIVSSLNDKAQSMYKAGNSNLIELTTIDKMMRICPNFSPSQGNCTQMVEEYIHFNSQQQYPAKEHLTIEQIKSLLLMLVLTKKGLQVQYMKIVGASVELLYDFLHKFYVFVASFKGYHIVSNRRHQKILLTIINPNADKIKTYHEVMARALKKYQPSFRKLEEEIYHLLKCENFNELKEVICKTENFLLLYTPLTKNLLCQCWVRLEYFEQYDPVFEYNKAIETFKTHYYPKEEELFKIIFQMCMFFKEYSEFENSKTPYFRHPIIRGEVDDLKEICIYDELRLMNMVGYYKSYKAKKQTDQPTGSKQSSKPVCPKKVDSKLAPLPSNTLRNKSIRCSGTQYLKRYKNSVGPQQTEEEPRLSLVQCENIRSVSQRPYYEKCDIISVYSLNVTILSNQYKFRAYYLEKMGEYMNEYYVPMKRNVMRYKYSLLYSDESDIEYSDVTRERLDKDSKVSFNKLKYALILKNYSEYLYENYHKSGEEQSYYYYKQWIWLQFPWICQSIKNDYSRIIYECITSSTQYMSVAKEMALIKQVLKIAQLAKKDKNNIYYHEKIELLPLRRKINQSAINISLNIGNTQRMSQEVTTDRGQSRVSNLKGLTGSKISAAEMPAVKYKLDLQTIDEYMAKEEQHEQLMQAKYSHYVRKNRNNFKGKEKENEKYFRSFLTDTHAEPFTLPMLGHSKLVRQSQTKDNQITVIKRYNYLKHANSTLIERIEQLKKTNLMLDRQEKKGDVYKLQKSIQESLSRKQKVMKVYQNQMQLKSKLETIIKICDINKTHGSESYQLAEFLASLKYMVNLEMAGIKAIKEQAYKLVEIKKVYIKAQKNRKRELEKEWRCKSKGNELAASRILEYKSTKKKYRYVKKYQSEILMKQKGSKTHKTKDIIRDIPHFDEYVFKVYVLFDLTEGYQKENEDKVYTFIERVEKNNELKLRNQELHNEIKMKQYLVLALEDEVVKVSVRQLESRNMRIRSYLIAKREKMVSLRNRNLLIVDALAYLEMEQCPGP